MNADLNQRFRANVKAELRARGWSPSQLAWRMCMNPSQVSMQIFRRTDHGLTLRTVMRYAAAFGVDPADLLRNPGEVRR